MIYIVVASMFIAVLFLYISIGEHAQHHHKYYAHKELPIFNGRQLLVLWCQCGHVETVDVSVPRETKGARAQ